MERPLAGVLDADVFGFELVEIDSGDGLAVDDEEEAVSGEEVGEDLAGVGAFDDGVEGVDDGLETAEALDLFDDGGDGGVEGGLAAGDEGGDAAEGTGGGVVDEDAEGYRSDDEGEEEDEEPCRKRRSGRSHTGWSSGLVSSGLSRGYGKGQRVAIALNER